MGRYAEAYKNLGNLLKTRLEWRPAAVRAYRHALALRPTNRETLLNLGELLQWLGHEQASNTTFALAVERGVWTHPQQRPTHWVPGIRSQPWWSVREIPLVNKILKPSTFKTIAEEARALLAQDERSRARGQPDEGKTARRFLQYQSPVLARGNWSDVQLMTSGTQQPGALVAPKTYALWAALGEDTTTCVMGQAYLSVLAPGTRLAPHCGPTNNRIRARRELFATHARACSSVAVSFWSGAH